MAESGAAMRRDDDEVHFLRCRDLKDFEVWRADDCLTCDLDLGVLGLWQ
jgi:hypothetical protein